LGVRLLKQQRDAMFWLIALLYLLTPEAPGEQPPARRDTIVVTGTYEPIKLAEIDRTVNFIDTTGLYLLSGHILEILALDPSLDVRERAPGGVQADLSIRGGTFGQTLILLNGLRLNDPQTGHHNLDLPLPLESVSRVEVLKGAGSTLYGSDAVGGAVNLITEAPQAAEARLGAAFGSFGTNQQRAVLATAGVRWAGRLAAARDFSSGFSPNRDYRNLSLAAEAYGKTRAGSSSLLLGHADRPFGAEKFYGNYPSWERTRTWFASLRQSFGSQTQAAFGFRRHTDLFYLYRYRPELYTNRHRTSGYQLSLRRTQPLGKNTRLYSGLEGTRDSIRSTNLGTHERSAAAGYLALDIRALGRFSLNAGLRQQLHTGRHRVLSPSLAVGVWVSRHLKLKASAGHAFRLPSFTDLYYRDPATHGNPYLKPEKAWSYEASAEWHGDKHLTGSLTVFERRETDGIDYMRGPEDSFWQAANIQRLRFTGLEAALLFRLRNGQQLSLATTHLRGAQKALNGMLSRYVFNYPEHNATLGWHALLPGGYAARLTSSVTKRPGRDAYSLTNIRLARTRGRWRPFLHLSNLTGAHYEEIINVPMPGRAILGGLEWVVAGRI